jgi:hypothetical protein
VGNVSLSPLPLIIIGDGLIVVFGLWLADLKLVRFVRIHRKDVKKRSRQRRDKNQEGSNYGRE